MVRLGPGPTCSPSRLKPGASGRCPPGPAEYVVSHFRPGPPGSGFGCVTFLSGRHESDTELVGRGCYWAWMTRPSPWSSGVVRACRRWVGRGVTSRSASPQPATRFGGRDPEVDDEVSSVPDTLRP